MQFHEFANDYPMMPAYELGRMEQGMMEWGFDARFPIVRYQGKILDGRNRYVASKNADVKPVFVDFVGTDEEAKQFVQRANEERRHLAADWLHRRRQERIDRVVAARAEGKSLRAIAETEGVDPKTIRKDLFSGGDQSPPEKVTGKDGKSYLANRPPLQTVEEAKRGKIIAKGTTDEPPEPDDMICDDDGNPVPAKLRAVFAEVYLFNSAVARLAKAAEALVRIEESPFYQTEGAKKYSTSCRTAEKRMIGLRPSKVCCGGGCDACGQKGYLTTEEVDHAPVS
jgi:ParB-like chromosome segregation protein Spo0J